MPPSDWEIFQTQLRTWGENINKNIDELKGMMSNFDARVRTIEKGEAGCQAIVATRLDAAWKKLDEHTALIKDIEKVAEKQTSLVDKLITAQAQLKDILKWMLGIVTSVVIVIVIALVTGQATVIFR